MMQIHQFCHEWCSNAKLPATWNWRDDRLFVSFAFWTRMR